MSEGETLVGCKQCGELMIQNLRKGGEEYATLWIRYSCKNLN